VTQKSTSLPVLVVDDSAVSRKLLEHALDSEPYQVHFASDGAEARRLFQQYAPRIVITDWMLPDLSGPELCRELRRAARCYTHILILTSNTDKENLVEGLASGADDYLTKPFDRQELLARLGVARRTIDLHSEIEEKNRELEELARTDHLTQLPNRRAVEDYAERHLQGAIRHKFPFWVVLVDVDCFKSVNDTHGHVIGDAVLARIAALLRKSTRAADICGRMGGDEFILVVSYADEEDILDTVERLRTSVAIETFEGGAGPVHVTASFGIAGYQGAGSPEFKELVDRADRALYAAKQAGRNQLKLETGAGRETSDGQAGAAIFRGTDKTVR
jgi:two-component system, cell cycle response regulator